MTAERLYKSFIFFLIFSAMGGIMFLRGSLFREPWSPRVESERIVAREAGSAWNWEVYENPGYHLRFRYPPELLKIDESVSSSIPVADFMKRKGEHLVTIALPEGAREGTNLVLAFMTLAVNPDLRYETECVVYIDREEYRTMSEKVERGGLTWFKGSSEGVALEAAVYRRLYHIFRNDTCFEANLNVFTGVPGSYPDGTIKPIDPNDALYVFENILDTLTIASSTLPVIEANRL